MEKLADLLIEQETLEVRLDLLSAHPAHGLFLKSRGCYDDRYGRYRRFLLAVFVTLNNVLLVVFCLLARPWASSDLRRRANHLGRSAQTAADSRRAWGAPRAALADAA